MFVPSSSYPAGCSLTPFPQPNLLSAVSYKFSLSADFHYARLAWVTCTCSLSARPRAYLLHIPKTVRRLFDFGDPRMIEAAGNTDGAVYSMSSKSSTLGDSVSPGSEDFSREAYHGSTSPPSRPPRSLRIIFINRALFADYINRKGKIKSDRQILNLVVILALMTAKDGYKDIKCCQSQIIAKVLSGGGWHNPNVLKSKASPSSELSSLAGGNRLLAHVTVEDTGNKKHSLNDDYDNNWWSMLKEYCMGGYDKIFSLSFMPIFKLPTDFFIRPGYEGALHHGISCFFIPMLDIYVIWHTDQLLGPNQPFPLGTRKAVVWLPHWNGKYLAP
ncbi:hypothetical protein EV421DRAFT_1744394 [Armillaria borealis]|uniref:Uncharacterized protein n=1 Tax=Armillaria borealis TaxID=47425 RepID=A0AA39IV69_9AGAR|nr:hypothetical protein EV421DRAFT_1744394 [Armillaria borealis]